MRIEGTVLGIDIGSVAVAVVETDGHGAILGSGYAFHEGRIRERLLELLASFDLARVRHVARTASTPDILVAAAAYDAHVAHIAAARALHADIGSLLIIGGQQFSLIRFDADGGFCGTRTNSSCAAGTGSFLDQQARSLGLSGSAELAATALAAGGSLPRIASRCAVFAKTDLIHAQQEGHTREAICSGLCDGLAAIVADTISGGEAVTGPVVCAGGVARNAAVIGRLAARLGVEILVDANAELYGALGAALLLEAELRAVPAPSTNGGGRHRVVQVHTAAELLTAHEPERCYEHAPLELTLSRYPEFTSERRYELQPRTVQGAGPVEVDVYERLAPQEALGCTLGIDIGSTSTKAVLLDDAGRVVAGLYTRTSGRPVKATQALLEAVADLQQTSGARIEVRGAGTTGAGRKLIGAILGADVIVDEITAHARAAVELDPRTDTIIEIGGQDSKFTTLRGGAVTSAVMNTVCAAGTGSFVEEQARCLGCRVDDYATVVAGASAPAASDRCTVFMQRDIGHLLGAGYEVPEVLATVLHAVRENYLRRVARGTIGEHICFQGATAKNRALVAAFEQRLGKPITVSRFCHLTGALGVAHLVAAESGRRESSFRGIELFRDSIPTRSEVCELCANHCKIAVAEVRGEVAAYGFLCGRDYGVERHVANNRSGFDLSKARKAALPALGRATARRDVTVGIPASIYLVEELELWRGFFSELGVRTVTSESCPDPVGTGKRLTRAELCAPMAAFHGHMAYLAERATHIFIPHRIEAPDRPRGVRRQYCYYSQYATALIPTMEIPGLEQRCLTPVLHGRRGSLQERASLRAALARALPGLSFLEISAAYSRAIERERTWRERLPAVMKDALAGADDISVVLLGRPYVCLSRRMNKGIPGILGAMGIKAFFQDMLPRTPGDTETITGLLRALHWSYASQIVEAALVAARTPGLYPCLLTSFKCAPDSSVIEYVRRILDAADKPYLVLELDEHDSSLGYETRIEAAVRAFRNHHAAAGKGRAPAPVRRRLPVNPELARGPEGKRLFVPNWDRLSCGLVVANMRREGIDAHLLHEDEHVIQRSLELNSGQCIPMTAVTQGFIEQVRAQGVDPAASAVWMIASQIACNLGFLAAGIKSLLESYGQGFEAASVYRGQLSLLDVSTRAAVNTYLAYMFGGLLRRMACRIRPYERRAGATDQEIDASFAALEMAFLGRRSKEEAVTEVVERLASIDVQPHARPKVAVFGDLYVRDNEVFSQDLIRFIERHGGEVVTTPFTDYMKIIAAAYFEKWTREGKYVSMMVYRSLLSAMKLLEKRYAQLFARVLGPEPATRSAGSTEEIRARLSLNHLHTGESLDNVLKIFHVLEREPEVRLFVQANPAFCCPSLVTEAMAHRIESVTGVPIVTLTYDGTPAPKADVLVAHLTYPRRRRVASPARNLAG